MAFAPISISSKFLQTPRAPRFLIAGVIVATFLAIGAYLIFARPKAVPSQVLFEKLFPSGSVVSELETIDLDVDGVLQNPIFRTLREYGPIPITVPPLGKTNPFL